ncbi:winged helix-turn-helix transcriptional regulator [Altererythrobacter aquiaggeris]|uniref:winged helix-turn-helix transcriptional regulator n=1 Tax=Aestuarierythrobacter aquiaggeris TaxID=1898396 RepID=UPI00301925F7
METIRACSIWRALEVIGDVPVLLVLEQSFLGTSSFEAIVEKTGLPRSVVSDRLKKLVAEDCLGKNVARASRRAKYQLTEKGRDLFPIALAMLFWQHRWETGKRKFIVRIHHSRCGRSIEPRPACDHCAEEIKAHEVDWKPGPGLAQVAPDYSRRRRPSKSITARREGGALVDTLIGIFGDRWSTLIVRAMFTGIHRFDQIQQDTLMASNILSGRIDELIESGILCATLYNDHPPRHEYRLTGKGRDLYPVILGMLQWGDKYYAAEQGPPLLLQHRICDKPLTMVMACSVCAEELRAGELDFSIEAITGADIEANAAGTNTAKRKA